MKQTLWWTGLIVALGVAIGMAFYLWQQDAYHAPGAPARVDAPPAAIPVEPLVRYPLDPSRHAEVLPPVDQSDPVLIDSLSGLVTRKGLAEFFFVDEIARRFVVTVDNLPRETVALRLRSAKPVPGQTRVRGVDDNIVLSPDNYRRFSPFVRMVDAVDAKTLMDVYARFYPLFQQEYRNLGYPTQYFNDRMVEAIDDLLDAPEVHGPVRLVQPRVLYQFADPELEALSAGQKMMIRMGPENAARIKRKLQALREELTQHANARKAIDGVAPSERAISPGIERPPARAAASPGSAAAASTLR